MLCGAGLLSGLLPSLLLHSDPFSHGCRGLGGQAMGQILVPEVMLCTVLFTFHGTEHFLCCMVIPDFKEALRYVCLDGEGNRNL